MNATGDRHAHSADAHPGVSPLDAPTVALPATGAGDDTASVRQGLGGLIGDVGLPLGTYYGLHALGIADTPALLAATVVAALRVGVVALRSRRLSTFAALMLGVYGIGLVLSFVSGDPHLMLAKDSVGTAVVGAGFLLSLAGARPMLLAAIQSSQPRKAAELTHRYATEPAVRRSMRGMTAMWGIGLLGEAVVRIPLVYALPISVGVGLSNVLLIVVIGLLAVGTALWVRIARRHANH